jgi:hypothetical protein
MTHRRSKSCQEEEIDDGQWAKIEPLLSLKTKKGLSDADKESCDFNNWFKIWKILFPGIPEPRDPCK